MDATIPNSKERQADPYLSEPEIIYRIQFEASTNAIIVETMDGGELDCNATTCQRGPDRISKRNITY
jgi:hypothetical protein